MSSVRANGSIRTFSTIHEARYSKLPVVEREVHNGLGVATFDTAASVRCQTVKHGLAEVSACPVILLRQFAQATVPPDLLCNSNRFALDALREKLEELLGVLMFSGGE